MSDDLDCLNESIWNKGDNRFEMELEEESRKPDSSSSI